MYDSIEAPLDTLSGAGPVGRRVRCEAYEARTLAHIAGVIEKVRGDSYWVDPETYASSLLIRVFRRLRLAGSRPTRSRRLRMRGLTHGGWSSRSVRICRFRLRTSGCCFSDGGKSDDSTALVLCRLSDGHVVTGGVWRSLLGPVVMVGWRTGSRRPAGA